MMSPPEFNVKHAIEIAVEHLRSLNHLIPVDGLRLEETTMNKQGNWLITFSVRDSGFPLTETRIYKDLEVSPKTKSVLSMKFRNPYSQAS